MVSDTMSRQKISTPANHEIAFRLTLATSVTENETITITFSSGFASGLNGIDCGDVDLLDDGDQENLRSEAEGCTADADEWGAQVSGNTLTLTAPSTPGTYIDGSSDVVIKIGTNATEEGNGDEQIVNPATPGVYLIQINGTFGDAKTIAINIRFADQVGITAQVGAPPHRDTTPPIIFNLQVINITQTSATVTWLTDEASTTYVDYGLTNSYELGTVAGISFTTIHSVDLTGLSPDTVYHFRVRSADFWGNEAVSSDQTFRTLALPDTIPPIISNIEVIDITENSATITWQTNEPATSVVQYGLTTAYELGTLELSDLVLSHSIPLSGLTADTLYHFRVSSTDAAGNTATSDDQTFRTIAVLPLDITPPVISNILVINITETSAEVTWQTDEPANSVLRYGLTTAYELGTITLGELVTSHSIPLYSLTPNTLYHFKVSSTDAAGNTATSTDRTFTTLPDRTPPANVTNFTATPTPARTIMLTWTNPTDPDFAGVVIRRSFDNYPRSPTDGELVFDGLAESFEDTNFTPDDYNRPVYYTIFAYDFSGNFSSGAVAQATIVVPVSIEVKAWPEKRWPRTGNWSTRARLDIRLPGEFVPIESATVITDDLGVGRAEFAAALSPRDVALKGLSHLRKVLRGVDLVVGENFLDFTLGGTFYLLAGDTHRSEDNLVNSLDLSYLLNRLNTDEEVSDLNRDGLVNSLDINILLANLMRWGEQ
ncbi:MAG: fibronectin type III domain-containing protein [Candidatus Bathyarchaeia archaeon]